MGFISYVFLTTFTPGPNNIMAMSIAGKYGFKKSLEFCVGVFFGVCIILLICATFEMILFKYIPKIELIMKYIGAVYILWLAYKTFSESKSSKEYKNKEIKEKKNFVFTAMALQLINPKLIVYGITSMSTFILPYFKSIPIITLLCLFLAVICFISTVCWNLFGTFFKEIFQNHSKVLNTILALLLVYCAVSLFL